MILLLIGGTGVVWGSYVQATDDCESGSSLSISPHAANENADPQTDPVAFGDLSPMEQRLFLEAYTSTDNSSDVPERWPPSRFDDTRVVTYRNQQYDIKPTVVDCGVSGKTATLGGVASSVVGVGLLGIVRVQRARTWFAG